MANNEIESLKTTVKNQEKVISLAKELVELIIKNADCVDDIDIVQKAEILSCDSHIMMARYP